MVPRQASIPSSRANMLRHSTGAETPNVGYITRILIYSCSCLAAVPPKIEVDPRYRVPQEVKQGSTLVLPVSYTAVPRPRTSWYHRGLPLSVRHGHIHIDSGDAYSTLTVLGIESNEGGKYEVSVENLAGVSKYEYDVIVKCECYASFD
jgi:hypothetical protein